MMLLIQFEILNAVLLAAVLLYLLCAVFTAVPLTRIPSGDSASSSKRRFLLNLKELVKPTGSRAFWRVLVWHPTC